MRIRALWGAWGFEVGEKLSSIPLFPGSMGILVQEPVKTLIIKGLTGERERKTSPARTQKVR